MSRLPTAMHRLAGAGLLLVACALIASCSDESGESPKAASSSPVPAAAPQPAERAQSIGDARRAADRDDHSAALAISKSLRPAQARSIRMRIANRLAERALAALDAGERGRAREIIIEAKSYPSTEQGRFARATYDAAKIQAADERRRNAEQRRVAEAMRRAASVKPRAMRMMPRSSMGTMPQSSMGMTPPP